MNEKKISSKAPFVSSAIFLGLLFWVSQTSMFGDDPGVMKLKLLMMGLYGILAIGASAYGAYLHKTGQQTIPGPRPGHMIWALLAVVVITVVGLVVVMFNTAPAL